MLGGPGETRETIEETAALMDEVSPRAILAMTGVRIYPGTRLEEIAVEEGVLKNGAGLLEPRFYFSSLGPDGLLKTAYAAAERRRNWFFPGRKHWSMDIGFRILSYLYQRGPLWKTFRAHEYADRKLS
jgi:radical SAM superfamily enzyme YgiQ (UPF0313 family)